MTTRNEQVKSLFDQTEIYLGKNFNISMRAKMVRELLGELTDTRILDLGCGDGSISLQFAHPGNDLTLVDLSEQMLAIARQRAEQLDLCIRFINTDLMQLEAAQHFDVIICLGVLAHVAAVEATIDKIAGLLNPGGRVVLQFTDR